MSATPATQQQQPSLAAGGGADVGTTSGLSSWFKSRLFSFWSASNSSIASTASSSSSIPPSPAASSASTPTLQPLALPSSSSSVSLSARSDGKSSSKHDKEKGSKTAMRRKTAKQAQTHAPPPAPSPNPTAPTAPSPTPPQERRRPPSPLRHVPVANPSASGSSLANRSGSPFRSLERSTSRTNSPFVSRSASPAISFSSTSAARHLARLSDAQVAELAAQVTVEMTRRRTPTGALVAYYERHGIVRGQPAPVAASRLSALNQEKFQLLASDLDAEAINRDIPGIDITGMRLKSLNRQLTSPYSRFGPNNPAAAEAAAAAASNQDSSPNALSSSPPNATAVADRSSATSPVPAGYGSPLLRTSSVASFHSIKTLPRHMSSTNEMTPEEERASFKARINALSDVQFALLSGDVRAEIERRKTEPHVETAMSGIDNSDVGYVPAGLAAHGSPNVEVLPPTPISPTTPTSPIAAPSAERQTDSPEEPSLHYISSNSTASHHQNPHGAAAALARERDELIHALHASDLTILLEDIEAEALVREKIQRERAELEKQQQQQQSTSATGGKPAKKESANVQAWRSRIAKLTDDQLAEVTADVFDEISRRKEKIESFLPPRDDLSPKRNEARKELAKLPSRELKTLWTIIHEQMKRRNMMP